MSRPNPNHSLRPLDQCERIARLAREEVQRIEERQRCLRVGDILADLIVDQLLARVEEP